VKPREAERSGVLHHIDNRKIAKLAKLSGAPRAKSAGISLYVRLGDRITKGQTLYTLHAVTEGELRYALDYKNDHEDIITIL